MRQLTSINQLLGMIGQKEDKVNCVSAKESLGEKLIRLDICWRCAGKAFPGKMVCLAYKLQMTYYPKEAK